MHWLQQRRTGVLWGMRSTLHEARILRDILLGDRFLVWGSAALPAMAN